MSITIRDLTPREVKVALDAGEIRLIDVREPAEFAARFGPTAQSMARVQAEAKEIVDAALGA